MSPYIGAMIIIAYTEAMIVISSLINPKSAAKTQLECTGGIDVMLCWRL